MWGHDVASAASVRGTVGTSADQLSTACHARPSRAASGAARSAKATTGSGAGARRGGARSALLVAALALSLPSAANARGPGLRVGDLVIHPSVEAGFGYDTNYFYESDAERDAAGNSATPNTASLIRAGLGVSAANRSPNKLGFKLEAGLDFRQAVAVGDNAEGAVSDRVVDERNGIDEVNGGLEVAILPRSPVTLVLDEDLRYNDRPAFDASVQGFQRLQNSVGADLRFRPGENPDARAFEMRLGYRLQTVTYLDAEDAGLTRYEKQAHAMRFLTDWRFLPKTSVLADFRYEINDYGEDALSVDRDSSPFRAELGLRGLVTKRVSVELRGGFLGTFNAEGESYSGVVGAAQVQYVLEPTLDLALRYEHDARDTGFSNYLVVDKVSARATLAFLERFELVLKGAYGLYDYSLAGSPVGSEKRDDPVLIVSTTFAYHLREWLELSASWQLEQNMSDYEAPPPTDATGQPVAGSQQIELAEYSRQLFLVEIGVHY